MMAALPAVKTVAELYPPQCSSDFWSFLYAVATPETDPEGNFVLRRALSRHEREALARRKQTLTPWLEAGPRNKVARAVTNMLVGWSAAGKAMTMEEAAAVATQYTVALAGVPLWAVERACIRFAGGQVRAEELKRKSIDWSFPPSSADLRIVAVEIARPFGEELTRIRMTLNGRAGRPSTASLEERAAALARIDAWLAERRGGDKYATEAEMAARNARLFADEERRTEEALRAYDALGLRRPPITKGKPVVTPSILMSLGWTVEEVDGDRVLVTPAWLRTTAKDVLR